MLLKSPKDTIIPTRTQSFCVYERQKCVQQFNKEHVVPQLLGHFKLEGQELLITDRVCMSCNNHLSKIESELALSSFEALMRSKIGITDALGELIKLKSHDLFYRRKRPIVAYAEIPGRPYMDFLALDHTNGEWIPLSCLLYWDQGKNRWWPMPYHHQKSSNWIISKLKKLRSMEVHVACTDDQWSDIERTYGSAFNLTRRTPITERLGDIRIQCEIQATPRLQRAITKIAFNYMMYFSAKLGVSGYEECFRSVREFITLGKPNASISFKYTNQHILPVGSVYQKAIPHRGHLLACGIKDNLVFAHLQFFTGKDSDVGTYCVALGKINWAFQKPVAIMHFFNLETSEVLPIGCDIATNH